MKSELKKEEEVDLVIKARTGDAKSFERLLGAGYERYIRSLAHQKIFDRSDAEDATMLSIEKVWEKLPKLSEPRFFGTWTYTTTVNTCYDFLRSQREHSTNLVSFGSSKWDHFRENCSDPNQNVVAMIETKEQKDIALEILSELSLDHQQAINLVILQGLKYREAAILAGVPTGTMQSRVHNAIRLLASRLKK